MVLEFYNKGDSYALLADSTTEEMDVFQVTDAEEALLRFQDYLFENQSSE